MAKYTLSLTDESGKVLSFRIRDLYFDDVKIGRQYWSPEEWRLSVLAKEMYRDALVALGKFPIPKSAVLGE